MDWLVMRLLDARVGSLPRGTAYKILYVSPHAYEDNPVRDAATDRLREDVAGHARRTDTGSVSLVTFTPEDLAAGWREHVPMEPPPPTNLYALVGYLLPNGMDTYHLREKATPS